MNNRIGFAAFLLCTVFTLIYIVLICDSFAQEYILDNFYYWGYPQWGWMYSSPKIYLTFNLFYLMFLFVFGVSSFYYLYKKQNINSFICSVFIILSALISAYIPTYNWNKQFEIFNAEKTIESSRIPEGKWWISKDNMNRYDDQSSWSKLKGAFGRGLWPGGFAVWGDYRIWIKPDYMTNTKGRRGLVFHGGTKNKSPWGIDMGNDIVDLAIRVRQSDVPLDIEISYNAE
jgi:hypothetical protein